MQSGVVYFRDNVGVHEGVSQREREPEGEREREREKDDWIEGEETGLIKCTIGCDKMNLILGHIKPIL